VDPRSVWRRARRSRWNVTSWRLVFSALCASRIRLKVEASISPTPTTASRVGSARRRLSRIVSIASVLS